LFIYYRKALKRINKSDRWYEKSKKELDILKEINSDYIVKYLGFDEDKDYLYIIMQLCEVYVYVI
jgi:serine/threonine protein kinase